MRLVVSGVEGVLETAVSLVGYDRLCLMLYEDPDLAADVFDAVGSRLLRFYERVAESDAVGACIVNDDWGFKTQTMLPPDHLRARVFPWTGRMVSACHRLGKPVILHSCGNLDAVMDDVIDVLRLDGKHSYEDAILPVERAFEQWGGRIAVVGGLDVDFLATRDPAEIRTRAGALARLSRVRGGLAVGSGNSIPSYVSMDRFAAMAEAVVGAG
jgi:uroporphyrinogen decarboxylase